MGFPAEISGSCQFSLQQTHITPPFQGSTDADRDPPHPPIRPPLTLTELSHPPVLGYSSCAASAPLPHARSNETTRHPCSLRFISPAAAPNTHSNSRSKDLRGAAPTDVLGFLSSHLHRDAVSPRSPVLIHAGRKRNFGVFGVFCPLAPHAAL